MRAKSASPTKRTRTNSTSSGICSPQGCRRRPETMRLLVDVSNVYARSRHAMPELKTSAGRPTGGLWGFVRTVDGVRKRFGMEPEDVWLCNEGGGKGARQAVFRGYKADG